MKKVVLLIAMLAVSFSGHGQNANVQTARTNAKNYLLKKLNNPGSYSPVYWGKLTPVYQDFSETAQAKQIDVVIEKYNDFNSILETKNSVRSLYLKRGEKLEQDSLYILYTGLIKNNEKDVDSLNIVRTALSKQYKPSLQGYYIEHKFRAKNRYNALVLTRYRISLNKYLHVIAAFDADEQDRDFDRQRQSIYDKLEALEKQ
ncbi:hypothetical protein ACFQ3S_11050 [Mucilaginibacter terrae]|uniref:hypothetical protein n=1 Tax=Mucilaginibacter terrae TaxID=1955052 RepID=UPI003624FC0D